MLCLWSTVVEHMTVVTGFAEIDLVGSVAGTALVAVTFVVAQIFASAVVYMFFVAANIASIVLIVVHSCKSKASSSRNHPDNTLQTGTDFRDLLQSLCAQSRGL